MDDCYIITLSEHLPSNWKDILDRVGIVIHFPLGLRRFEVSIRRPIRSHRLPSIIEKMVKKEETNNTNIHNNKIDYSPFLRVKDEKLFVKEHPNFKIQAPGIVSGPYDEIMKIKETSRLNLPTIG